MEAVIAEVSRINTIAPLCPPHSVERDAYLNGYILPKVIYINLFLSIFFPKYIYNGFVFVGYNDVYKFMECSS